jgi:hypothetical protein
VQSTKFEFILNLKTATVLGLDVPPTLSARANQAPTTSARSGH